MKLTAKIKLTPTSDQHDYLLSTLKEANAACNLLSTYAFENKVFRQFDIHKNLYYSVKECFNLSAQMVVRCISKVSDAYKLDKKVQRVFKETGGIAYDDRILSYKLDRQTVSIWATQGRQTIPFQTGDHQLRLLQHRKGESDLVLVKGKFYLLAVCEIPDEDTDNFDDVLGIDLGIVNIATTSLGKSFCGADVESSRTWHLKRKSVLQKVGTKSAKKRLKKLSGKQANFQKNTNHCISKTIVETAKTQNLAIALEDLKGVSKNVTKEAKRLRKSQRGKHSNWSFYQLRSFITYKSQLQGVTLFLVDPRNTSRTCNICGNCDKLNRKSQSEFVCKSCGHKENADLNAAKNISKLGYINKPMVSNFN